MYGRYTLLNSVYITLFTYILITYHPSAVYIWRESIRCKQIKLLITATFAGSWIEIQQPIICGLTEYMVGCAWSELHRLSPFALDVPNLNLICTETLIDVDMRLYFVELFFYITYCVSEHVSRAGHLDSVVMIMRIMTITVIIFIARSLSKLFESVTSGTYRQPKFWNRHHDTE